MQDVDKHVAAIEDILEALQARRAIARIVNVIKGEDLSEERVLSLVPVFDHNRHILKYLGRIGTTNETESPTDVILERILSQVCKHSPWAFFPKEMCA